MKKILLSLSVIVAVAAVLIGATTAFYNDTEVSKDNVLAAGAIDLGVDNESYYNGNFNEGTSWQLDWDMDENDPKLFFNFRDLKPGDWGEDTISLHVRDNESWLCADVQLTKNDDVTCTDPEGDVDNCSDEPDLDMWDGDLASELKWYWWADDGDNVYETCEGSQVPNCVSENLIHSGVSFPSSPVVHHVTLADSNMNIWSGSSGDPIDGAKTYYIGKAWCFGNATTLAYPQDGMGAMNDDPNTPANENNGPDVRKVVCDGAPVGNASQTDMMMMDLTFRAEQARHNDKFVCQPQQTLLPQCSDGIDNDDPEDTDVDAADEDCHSGPDGAYNPLDNNETPETPE